MRRLKRWLLRQYRIHWIGLPQGIVLAMEVWEDYKAKEKKHA